MREASDEKASIDANTTTQGVFHNATAICSISTSMSPSLFASNSAVGARDLEKLPVSEIRTEQLSPAGFHSTEFQIRFGDHR